MTDDSSSYALHIDEVLDKLVGIKDGERVDLGYKDMLAIAYVARALFIKEPMCLDITAPLKICGDIHGQFIDLMRLFKLCGFPPDNRFLFLGDYVDRGTYSLECICLLYCLKIKYPTSFYLLRGNHECETLNRSYGFRDEIRARFGSSKVWKAFLKTFNCMPVAAIVENTVFCCHGGLSPLLLKDEVKSLRKEISTIVRPADIVLEGLLCDLVWSDPIEQAEFDSRPEGWEENDRGCSWTFGFDIIEKFLEKFDLDLVVRAHQVVEDGYEFYCDRKLITIFSAPHYCGRFDNAGGVFCLKKDLKTPSGQPPLVEGSFIILKPDYDLPDQWEKIPKQKKPNK